MLKFYLFVTNFIQHLKEKPIYYRKIMRFLPICQVLDIDACSKNLLRLVFMLLFFFFKYFVLLANLQGIY